MEKQQPESEDGIEGTRTTVRCTSAAELEKGWGLLTGAENARACAVGHLTGPPLRYGQSESQRVKRRGEL